ncbi:DUF2207 domain-containing protein [Oceanobacillus piezotolerans]|nr:DUF2207 domain-containing protein [Oceanobacillus piezotolerans]
MKKMIGFFFVLFIVIFLTPIYVFAVDFTIEETVIDAYLQENGNVQVTEFHTYEFDGEFNGITRTLIPKKGTSITEFKASENGQHLKTDWDEGTYKIFRGGEDEVVTIELSYVITDGVEVYEDMAQFYWPFFDSSNESDYENLTITVHPPQATSETIAYGFDEAYGTETIQKDGTVIFQLGYVNSGKKGDIRVAYDHAIFPNAKITGNEPIRNELLKEQKELAEKEAAFLKTQETLNQLAPYLTGIAGLLLFFFIFNSWRKSQTAKLEADRMYHSSSIVPKERMSMPATIYYFRNAMVEYGELLTAAMMDLVRKGHIEQRGKDSFYLKNTVTTHAHETLLLKLLFKKIGKEHVFSFDMLKSYTKKEENKQELQMDLHQYQKMLKQEMDTHQLIDKHRKQRWIAGMVSLLLIPVIILFGIYGLYGWLVVNLVILAALLLVTFLLQTRTTKGHFITQEWKRFKEEYGELQWNNWYSLSEDDKERAMIFSTGIKDKKLSNKNRSFVEKLQVTGEDSGLSSTYLLLFLMSTTATSSFSSATQASAQSTSSYSGSGSGVGGGGGGSGAF